MVEIRRSTVIDAPLEAVWAILRDFNGHDRWHPAVARSAIEEGDGGRPGRRRAQFSTRDGGRIREQLLALSDARNELYLLHSRGAGLPAQLRRERAAEARDRRGCLPLGMARLVRSAAPRRRSGSALRRARISSRRASARFANCSARAAEFFAAQPAPARAPSAATSGLEATAIVLTRYGGPEVLETRKIFARRAGPGRGANPPDRDRRQFHRRLLPSRQLRSGHAAGSSRHGGRRRRRERRPRRHRT